jgi:Holliday junction resolvase-like predicted endonuclease
MPRTPQQRLGKQGEDRALAHLRAQGLTLLERNFLCKAGEIDLILMEGPTLVFVEVRRRGSARFGGAVYTASRRPSSSVCCALHNIICCATKSRRHAVSTWLPSTMKSCRGYKTCWRCKHF